MRLCIEVNNNDIKNGEPSCYNNCPIARAIKRKLNPEINVLVSSNGIISINDDGQLIVKTKSSKKRRQFIEKFDWSEQVKPIKFLLSVPIGYIRKKYRNRPSLLDS